MTGKEERGTDYPLTIRMTCNGVLVGQVNVADPIQSDFNAVLRTDLVILLSTLHAELAIGDSWDQINSAAVWLSGWLKCIAGDDVIAACKLHHVDREYLTAVLDLFMFETRLAMLDVSYDGNMRSRPGFEPLRAYALSVLAQACRYAAWVTEEDVPHRILYDLADDG